MPRDEQGHFRFSEENRKRMLSTCRHFNGLANDCCDTGHRYVEEARPLTDEEAEQCQASGYARKEPETFALGRRIPCFADNDFDACPDRHLQDEAYIEARELRVEASGVRTSILFAEITRRHGKWSKRTNRAGAQAVIPCPVLKERPELCEHVEACEGEARVGYARASVNGHVHAGCSCGRINFMQ